MRFFSGTILAFALAATPLAAQFPELGHTTFPTSGSAEAQKQFIKGVLLLHSFEYERARESFRTARHVEPGYAMAAWGEAMTWNHPVWFRQSADSARAVLEQAHPAPTDRERAYLDAVRILFGDGPKVRRDTLYMEAMRALHHRWPDDENAAAFYALSILGTSHGGRHVPTYLSAAAVVEPIFAKNPRHPGAAHYLIHSYDDPENAPKGLPAARAYIDVAPDAAHAQHMTTHIFVAIGMWDQVVSQNSVAANQTHWGPGHYTSWLGYGYLQQGRHQAALDLLERAREKMNDSPAQRAYLIEMRGDYIAATEQWDSPVLDWKIDTKNLSPADLAEDAFVKAYAAFGRQDIRAMERNLSVLARAARSAERMKQLESAERTVPRILEAEVRGLMAYRMGSAAAAARHLAIATSLEDAMPYEFGPPAVVKPSHELFGEVLLMASRYQEALAQFQRQLELTPKRARSLAGLARAARRLGDEEIATRAQAELDAIWHAADEDVKRGY